MLSAKSCSALEVCILCCLTFHLYFIELLFPPLCCTGRAKWFPLFSWKDSNKGTEGDNRAWFDIVQIKDWVLAGIRSSFELGTWKRPLWTALPACPTPTALPVNATLCLTTAALFFGSVWSKRVCWEVVNISAWFINLCGQRPVSRKCILSLSLQLDLQLKPAVLNLRFTQSWLDCNILRGKAVLSGKYLERGG